MEKLGLSVKPTTPFRVYIGNGDHLLCSYYCPHVTIVLQGNSFSLDLYLLPIEGPEVVLGIQWLQSLGRVCHDYKALTMEFSWKGKTIILRGDLSTTCKVVTFNQLQAILGHEEFAELYELHQLSNSETPTWNSSEFQIPESLPS